MSCALLYIMANYIILVWGRTSLIWTSLGKMYVSYTLYMRCPDYRGSQTAHFLGRAISRRPIHQGVDIYSQI